MRKYGFHYFIKQYNIGIVFSNDLQKIHKFRFFFHHEWYIGVKSTPICKFKENKFSKDFGTGTFKEVLKEQFTILARYWNTYEKLLCVYESPLGTVFQANVTQTEQNKYWQKPAPIHLCVHYNCVCSYFLVRVH